LRAIDSRTVLARWHERTGGGVEADLEAALAVARATGARHAVLGTAVATGSQVRLAANVRELERGELVHQAQVDGPTDSMILLVDRLSIELLRFLLHKGAAEPRTDLASVTTESIEALKAFLNGELLYRQGEYESADEAYQRAVAADSNFALAYYRLGLTRGWTEAAGTELALGPLARADSLANLPRREAGLVRAALAVVRTDATAIDSARVLTQRYPDDPEAWYLLGELYYHTGFLEHVGWAETEAAFLRAIELDPRWAPHYIHLVDLAYRYHADSAIAAERMSRYRELAPESPWNRYYDWLFTLAFADSAARAGAIAELEAAELLDLDRGSDRLSHPGFWPVRERLLKVERQRAGATQPGPLRDLFFGNIMSRGWLAAGLGYLDEARAAGVVEPCDLMGVEIMLRTPSYPFEDELAPTAIAAQEGDEPADPGALIRGLACGALYSAYRGRQEEYRALYGRLDEMRPALAAQDTSAAVQMAALMRLLDGLAAWLAGDPAAAYEKLHDYTAPSPELSIPNLWWGRILLETERPDEAIPYFVGERNQPLPHLYLGAAYEALGRDAEARDAYRYFLTWWSDADPELQPLVDEARQSLTRIAARLR
jgi:tetratricopeptide (TPR) repeat protein